MMKLSVLIPTMYKRAAFYERLMAILRPQLERTQDAELLTCIDGGELTIGAKRNKLLAQARGEYVVFIDDDDRVTDDYLDVILKGIETGFDVVCVNAIHTTDGKRPKLVIDIPYNEWTETPEAYLRGVQWRDAIKREIALSVPYPDVNFGEDHYWSIAIEATKVFKTWLPATKPTYFHEFVSVK